MAPGRWMATAALAAVMVARAAGGDLPRPGIGVFFRADEAAALREKVQKPPCKAIYEQLLKRANEALAKWPEDKAKLRFEELMPKLPDIQTEFVPKEFLPEGGKEAGMALGNYGKDGAPAAAFVYLITGERKYADFAWEVFELCAKANRWGWFPWSGSHMPQIHFGILSRGLVLVADCVWDTLTPAQRQLAREAIADKCVEPYFRIVLHTPGMGLFHLRSLNQGNNALAAALMQHFRGRDVPVPQYAAWGHAAHNGGQPHLVQQPAPDLPLGDHPRHRLDGPTPGKRPRRLLERLHAEPLHRRRRALERPRH